MKNTNQSAWSKLTTSITFKAFIIGFLMLITFIPASLMQELIQERERSSNEVASEVSSKWGNRQTLTGPILTIPYIYDVVQDNKITKVREYAYFLPETLNVEAEIKPEIRYRSIYKVVVYGSEISMTGHFNAPDFEKLNAKASSIDWQDAFITLGISDLRGIRNNLDFTWNGAVSEVISGTENSGICSSGVTVKLPLAPPTAENNAGFDFETHLYLNGSEGLYFTPVGKTTTVHAGAPWNDPGFSGAFLPMNRDIQSDQFSATWEILSYNRNFPQMWTNNDVAFDKSEFGVDLILPVDHYQQTMRSVKYAFLFIALTFMVFFLVELISKKYIHPMQYLLVSIGLILFYTLLLAISEQIGFTLAYIISAVAIVALITSYSYSIFKKVKQTLIMGGFLALLYTFLFVILQLEDFALLMGSIGLFIALAVIMYISRKIDWSQPAESIAPEQESAE